MREAVLDIAEVKGGQAIKISKRRVYKAFKRSFDFLFALICLIVLSPVFLIIMALIRLDSKGNAMFTQKRIGRNGKTIKIYKFRSMVNNAEAVLEELVKKDSKIREEYAIYKKIENDPRITKIGHILRKTSLDELPQIINILKGEMSLIGPRPYNVKHLPSMEGYVDYVAAFRPGLTGMWQANGRSSTTFNERLEFDKYYYNNFSFKLDFKIFVKTIAVVLDRKGAK